MATFCSKCGAELSPGAHACTACGAPVAIVATVVPPAQPVAVPPPPKQGNSALKIVLIIVAVFVGLGILGASAFGYFMWRVAHAIHVASESHTVTVNSPTGGSFSANTGGNYTSAELGTDVYPGAQSGKGGMRMTLPSGSMVSAVYLTSDSKDQVTAFYKSRFGSGASSFDAPTGTILTVNKSPQESVVVTITPGSGDNQGKTQISIVHTTSTKSQ